MLHVWGEYPSLSAVEPNFSGVLSICRETTQILGQIFFKEAKRICAFILGEKVYIFVPMPAFTVRYSREYCGLYKGRFIFKQIQKLDMLFIFGMKQSSARGQTVSQDSATHLQIDLCYFSIIC